MNAGTAPVTHTPGPWHVAEIRHEYDCLVRNRDNDPVCATAFAGYSRLTAEANARLIAAAPELLDALRLAVRMLPDPTEDAPCHRGITSMAHCGHCQRLGRLRAAIAKAEGGA